MRPSSTSGLPTMPRALAVHAACFAIGAAVGGGIATAVSVHGRRSVAVPSPATPSVMEAAPAGATKALILAPTREATSPALKFGHPGALVDHVDDHHSSCGLPVVVVRAHIRRAGTTSLHGSLRSSVATSCLGRSSPCLLA